jgi:hypothetical protein
LLADLLLLLEFEFISEGILFGCSLFVAALSIWLIWLLTLAWGVGAVELTLC